MLLRIVQPVSPPQYAAAAALRFLVDAGCDVPVTDSPRRWLDAPVAQPALADAPVQDRRAPVAPSATPSAAPAPATSPRTADPAAPHPALACETIDALLALLGRFPDAKTRAPLLFDGAIDARVWVLIDRPDHEPGHRETIDKMMTAIGLDWSRAALVSRLPWPTPGDGEPTASLLGRFTPVLERLFALAPPTHVLALGQLAADMAGPNARLASSRGRWFDWGDAKLLPSLHPRTMRGSKDLRLQAFEHLKMFKAALP
jgi:DNA polymerase